MQFRITSSKTGEERKFDEVNQNTELLESVSSCFYLYVNSFLFYYAICSFYSVRYLKQQSSHVL